MAATLVVTMPVESQSQNSKLDKLITIPAKEIAVESLLQMLIRNTGMQFSYNSHKVKNIPRLRVVKHTLTAAQWLRVLKETTKIDYKILGDHIIFTESKRHVVSLAAVGEPTRKNKTKTTSSALRASAKFDARAKAQQANLPATDTTKHGQAMTAADGKNMQEAVQQPILDTAKSLSENANNGGNTVDTSTTTEAKINSDYPQAVKNERITKEKNDAMLQKLTKFDVGPQGLGIGLERKLTNKVIVDISAGLGGNYLLTPGRLKYRFSRYDFGTYVSVTSRWYYNGTRKRKDESEYTGNSGNYLGARVKYVHDLTKVKDYGSVMLFNIHYGIQRMLADRVLINGHIGPGYAITTHSRTEPLLVPNGYYGKAFYPSLDIKLSYILNRRRNK